MHIPIQPESADDFIERVSALIQDDRTHLYFDTSFLMWLTTGSDCAEHDRRYQSIAMADDIADADGAHVFSFAQAQEAARKWFARLARRDRGKVRSGPYTICEYPPNGASTTDANATALATASNNCARREPPE